MRRLTTAAVVAAVAVSLAACSPAAGTAAPGSPSSTTTPSPTASSATTSSATTGSATTSSPATSVASGRTISITVTGSTVTPAPTRVDLPVGETLTVVVTSDHADELHAHGFEVEQEIAAGVPATIALTGKEPGVYEVELHHPALTLLTVAVR